MHQRDLRIKVGTGGGNQLAQETAPPATPPAASPAPAAGVPGTCPAGLKPPGTGAFRRNSERKGIFGRG